jgi:hypothetical protein
MMEAVTTTETSVNFYVTTRCNILEDNSSLREVGKGYLQFTLTLLGIINTNETLVLWQVTSCRRILKYNAYVGMIYGKTYTCVYT